MTEQTNSPAPESASSKIMSFGCMSIIVMIAVCMLFVKGCGCPTCAGNNLKNVFVTCPTCGSEGRITPAQKIFWAIGKAKAEEDKKNQR